MSHLQNCFLDRPCIELHVRGPHQITELWMQLHSIHCLVDELYSLRLKGPPFVGYSLKSDVLTFKFCSSLSRTLLSLQLPFKFHAFPFHLRPAQSKVTVLKGDPTLVQGTLAALSTVESGIGVVGRMVDVVKL